MLVIRLTTFFSIITYLIILKFKCVIQYIENFEFEYGRFSFHSCYYKGDFAHAENFYIYWTETLFIFLFIVLLILELSYKNNIFNMLFNWYFLSFITYFTYSFFCECFTINHCFLKMLLFPNNIVIISILLNFTVRLKI